MNLTVPDQYFQLGDMPLALGQSLPSAVISYVTLGQLAPSRDNAILILHGYTSSHRFVLDGDPDNAEGSWGPLIGPAKAIDTNRFMVIAPNFLGSSYGSTGPASPKPGTNHPWGPDFPALTFEDQVNAQKKLLDHLGIEKLHAVIGLSMGGFGAFQWAVQHPGFIRKVIPVLTAPWGSLNQAASERSVAQVLDANPFWASGHYYPHIDQLYSSLEQIRLNTLTRYGVPQWLEHHHNDANQAREALGAMAAFWAKRFDANSLLTLRAAINRFDVRSKLHLCEAQFLYVLSNTDTLFPPAIAQETLARLPKRPQSPEYVEINSAYGHFASSLDWAAWQDELAAFLA